MFEVGLNSTSVFPGISKSFCLSGVIAFPITGSVARTFKVPAGNFKLSESYLLGSPLRIVQIFPCRVVVPQNATFMT